MLGLLDEAYNYVLYNYEIKKTAMSLLSSPVTVCNPVYLCFYNNFMKKRMKQFNDVPFRVMVENSNICNLTCTFCPHKAMKRKQGVMGDSLFEKILGQCKSFGVDYVTIYGFGEPLIDPSFCRKVDLAKKRGLSRVTTNTNGLLLNEVVAENLIKSGLDEIYVSVDANTPETYQKVRNSNRFSVVEGNIRSLIRKRHEIGRKNPTVTLSYVESELNKHETRDFVSKWQGIVNCISISKIHNWTGDILIKSNAGYRMRDPCRLLWTDMVINWDGKVPLCCNDYENSVTFGDLNLNSLEAIWSGQKMKWARGLHTKRRFNKISACRNCTYNYHDKSPWWVSK
jgi:radical SAM protein with 4Fe4S-binding SPASM domain